MDASSTEAASTSAMVQQSSASTSTAQQFRSRITVVCAECKRLKLKCDRKQPCGSCTKRDTVSKCQYTAAAAEKVDIHSLHNRTTQLETFMTMYTNGRFQSSYPSTNISSSVGITPTTTPMINDVSFKFPHHKHHHHSAASLTPDVYNNSISRSFQNLASALSDDLELAISNASLRDQTSGNTVESEMHHINGASADGPVPLHSPWNSPPLSPRIRMTQSSTKQGRAGNVVLPSMGVYFPYSPLCPNPSNPFLHRSSPSPCNNPQVSPELLACLPSLPMCRRLLQNAGDFFRVQPLQFDPRYGSGNGWMGFEKKCLQVLGDSGKGRNGKSMSTKRAKEIYMAGQPQHHLNRMDLDMGGNPDQVHSPGGDTSLTFFAMMCATFAIGAASSNNDDESTNPAFFYSIAQQTLGVWDTCRFSSTSWVANDCEGMEYILACLLCTLYLLRSGTVAAVVAKGHREGQDCKALEDEQTTILSSLVGKMVTTARAMHLDKDCTWTKQRKKKNLVSNAELQDAANISTGGAALGQEREATEECSIDQWKRMVWWEIVFYDLFIADALGQLPYIAINPHTTSLPVCVAPPSTEGREASDGDIHPSEIALPVLTTLAESNDSDVFYFSARYRLVQIAQAIKKRNSLPDCCCGYTFDQAVFLESEVKTWLDGLPAVLKVPIVNGGTNTEELSWSGQTYSEVAKRLQAFEFAIIANVLVVNIYSPFLRGTGNGHGRMAPLNTPAASSCTYAARAVIRLALSLQTLLASCPVSCVFPVMFDFVPLDGLMSDAAVICAHAAFTDKLPFLPFNAGALVEDVAVGLKVLSSYTSHMIPTTAATRQKALEALQVHLDRRQQGGMKRKHHRIGETSVEGSNTQGASNTYDVVADDTINFDDHNQRDSHDLPESQIAADRTMLGSFSGQTPKRGVNREKDKKGTKKSGYPTVGVRIREGRSIIHDSRMPPPQAPKPTNSQARTLPPSEAVLRFKQKLQQRPDRSRSGSPPTSSPTGSFSGDLQVEVAGYASSSSANQVSESLKSSLNLCTPLPDALQDGVELPPRKRQNLHDIRDSPSLHHQQNQQPIVPFHSSVPLAQHQHILDQPLYGLGASLSAQPSLSDGMVYGVASTSSFSNASSPFTSTASPHTTPPLFGTTPLLSLDQPTTTTYFSPQVEHSNSYVPTYPDESSVTTTTGTTRCAAAGMVEDFTSHHHLEIVQQQQQNGQNHHHAITPFGSGCADTSSLSERHHPMTSSNLTTPWPTHHSQTYWEEDGFRFYSS